MDALPNIIITSKNIPIPMIPENIPKTRSNGPLPNDTMKKTRFEALRHRPGMYRGSGFALAKGGSVVKQNPLIVKRLARNHSRTHSFFGFLAYNRIIYASKYVIWKNLTESRCESHVVIISFHDLVTNGNACAVSTLIPG